MAYVTYGSSSGGLYSLSPSVKNVPCPVLSATKGIYALKNKAAIYWSVQGCCNEMGNVTLATSCRVLLCVLPRVVML